MSGKGGDIRYGVLDKCFGNFGRKYFMEDLIEECSNALKEHYGSKKGTVSKRTIQYDITYMETKGDNPIVLDPNLKEGKERYYRYLDPKFSWRGLNQSEKKKINETLSLLLKFKGQPQFNWIHETIAQIKSELKIETEQNPKEVMSFESNPDLMGHGHITELFNAIINKRVLKIMYQDFKTKLPYEVILHPYYLKQFNSRWYVIGYNPLKKVNSWTVALDRIKNKGIKEIKGEYINDDTDWEDYFSDFIGMSKYEGKPVEIKLLITDAEQASYIETKPLHQTQKKIKEVKGGFETSIKVIPNYELEKLILSYGARIQVVSPKEVRDKFKEHIKKMKDLY